MERWFLIYGVQNLIAPIYRKHKSPSDEAVPDRIGTGQEDDGDRRGCRLGSGRRCSSAGRGDHSDLSANPRFGDWNIVYQRFNRWAKRGVFDRIFKLLASDADNDRMPAPITIEVSRSQRRATPRFRN